MDSGERAAFATTHWSVVLAAGDTAAAGSLAALTQLCQDYWFPLYAHIRRRGSRNPTRPARPVSLASMNCWKRPANGGMGVVYRARHLKLHRVVALKLVLLGQFSSVDTVRRFEREAQTAAALRHPGIVGLLDIGEIEGQPYFTMELVEGRSLASLLREGPLPARLAATHLRSIAQAVQAAHTAGIVHRDLKPSNILIDPFDQPRITDFGLAKRLDGSGDITHTGHVLGSPNYLAPELATGREMRSSPGSDIFSLGTILYECLTGRPPFLAPTLQATLISIGDTEPVPARRLNSSVPRDLETICLKCLEREPAKRYGTAQELADELDRFLRDEPIRARPITPPERVWRWCKRKPVLASLIIALHLVGAAGLVGILWQWRRAERHAVTETAQRLHAEQTTTLLEFQRAENLLEKDETIRGVAYLARLVRRHPTNNIAAQRLASALTMRNFALPVGPPLRHDKKVNYAEFSPDGRRAVTTSMDFTARIWDARTGAPVAPPFIRGTNAVRSAHFSPDGRRLVTVTDDEPAKLWDTATLQSIGQPMPHAGQIHSAQFSPDGRHVLTAGADGTARLWNGRTGEPELTPLIHPAPVLGARFSADGRRIITRAGDAMARIWDAQTAQLVTKPLPHRARINTARFSGDGRFVLTASDDATARI